MIGFTSASNMTPNGRTRRHVVFSREGWSFIAILAFVVFGSLLRQINLLVMLASMMIPALLFNWRMAVTTIRRISVRHRAPPWIFAGKTTVIELEVVNESRSAAAWNIQLTDTLRRVAPVSNDRSAKNVELVAVSVEAGQTSHISYRCFFAERGIYRLGPVIVACQFPFGLVRAWFEQRETAEVYVAPRLGEIQPTWNKRLDALAVGFASAARRRGWLPDEFFGLRHWQQGDTTRAIHWRSSAKRGQLVVKQYDQPTDRDFALALELFAPEVDDQPSRERIEHGASFVATVMAHLNYAVHGRVAVAVCGAQSRLFTNQVAGEFVGSVMQELAAALPAAQTDLIRQVKELAARVSRGTPIIVVTTRENVANAGELTPDNGDLEGDDWRSSVHWIHVGSSEFHEMFTPATTLDLSGMPVDNAAILGSDLEE